MPREEPLAVMVSIHHQVAYDLIHAKTRQPWVPCMPYIERD